jgi:hypothetical protein
MECSNVIMNSGNWIQGNLFLISQKWWLLVDTKFSFQSEFMATEKNVITHNKCK